MKFEELKGKTIVTIDAEIGADEVRFSTSDNNDYRMFHRQDCCERVLVEDIIGDLADLLGSPILMAEEVSSETPPEGEDADFYERPEWTFYKLATTKGTVTLRWFGQSDWYSTSVDFEQL